MERSVAIKKLGKLIGKGLGYRINAKAPSQEERDAAKAALPIAIEERKKLEQQRNERHRAILAADPEYQALRAAHRTARDRVDTLSSITRHRKITVGVMNDMFFLVKAEGDSWEEIISKLEAKS